MICLMAIKSNDLKYAEKLSKNSSRGAISQKLAPRTVGGFSVNACRNALCSSFTLPPILHSVNAGHARGQIKGSSENRSYYCNECGKSSRLKSNTALVEEYARLRTLNRGTDRERYPNEACLSHGVPQSLMPSAYRVHGKTPKGDPRFQCKSCKKTFSIGSPKRRHRETKETGEILRLLVNNVPLRRIMEISGVPADRLYRRIDFLYHQCRDFSARKDRNLRKGFAGRNRVVAFDVQTILANWRHAHRVLNVPVHHAVTVDKQTGYVIAATTDFDPGTDAVDIEREMYQVDDFDLPRAWRLHGRVWAYGEYRDSVLRGVNNLLTEGEKALSGNTFDLPGEGSRVRGDIFQAAHIMMVKKLIGSDYRQLLLCVDGDSGLAHIANMLFANDVMAGKAHVADVRFTKGLRNRRRVTLTNEGEAVRQLDVSAHQKLMDIAGSAYGLETDMTRLVAARLLAKYGAVYSGQRGQDLSSNGYDWKYHRKEEPEQIIRLLTDRGDLSFGDLAILLSRSSMAPVDKYFALVRRRIKAFDRGARPTSGETTWYVNAFYDPRMIEKVATIFRFYYNYMLLESAEGGKPKAERQTPAMKIGTAKGLVYIRDVLSFS